MNTGPKEQDKLLSTQYEDLPDTAAEAPTEHKVGQTNKQHGRTAHNDQRTLSNPNSVYEVSVAGIVIEVSSDFNEALKVYNRSLRSGSPSLKIVHILNGKRITVLKSAEVRYRESADSPFNQLQPTKDRGNKS